MALQDELTDTVTKYTESAKEQQQLRLQLITYQTGIAKTQQDFKAVMKDSQSKAAKAIQDARIKA